VVDDGSLGAHGSERGAAWLLAIECATRSASVALLRDGAVVGERTCLDRGNHAEHLLGMLDDLLADASISLEAVDGLAVSIGPGSFTSIRVGIATVKGLAFGSDTPVAPISTLAALALEAGAVAGTDVAAALDARRGEVYGGVFRCGAGGRVSLEPRVAEGLFPVEEFARVVPHGCLAVGSGAELCEPALRDGSRGVAREVELRFGVEPTARAVGRLGAAMLARGDGIAAAELAPRYLRRAEAEALRLGSQVEEAG
jgi:tRNA threonylcarbamoyladenosine biosynthesis protein TsaB